MKISKYLWVQKGIRFNKFRKMQLKMQNKCKGKMFLVCTSYNNHLLFDIIENQYLTYHYDTCYLVAVTKSKEEAINYVGILINQLYNLKIITYDRIKT